MSDIPRLQENSSTRSPPLEGTSDRYQEAWLSTVTDRHVGATPCLHSESGETSARSDPHPNVHHPSAHTQTHPAAVSWSAIAPPYWQDPQQYLYSIGTSGAQHRYDISETARAMLLTHDDTNTRSAAPGGVKATRDTERCCGIASAGCCRFNPFEIYFTDWLAVEDQGPGPKTGSSATKSRSRAKPGFFGPWSVRAQLVPNSTPFMETRADGVTKVNFGVGTNGYSTVNHWTLTELPESYTNDPEDTDKYRIDKWPPAAFREKLTTCNFRETLLHVHVEPEPYTGDKQRGADDSPSREEQLFRHVPLPGERIVLIPQDLRASAVMLAPLGSVESEPTAFTSWTVVSFTAGSKTDKQLKMAVDALTKARLAAKRETAKREAKSLRRSAGWTASDVGS